MFYGFIRFYYLILARTITASSGEVATISTSMLVKGNGLRTGGAGGVLDLFRAPAGERGSGRRGAALAEELGPRQGGCRRRLEARGTSRLTYSRIDY